MDTLTYGPLLISSQWQCGKGRPYKWTTIHCLIITVRRWTFLEMDHYSLLHSDSAKMDPLRNEPLFTASQWLCGDGCSYKWTTIHCFTVTVWEMDALANGPLFISSQWQCGDGRSYKWTTIYCPTVRVWLIDTLTNGPLFMYKQPSCIVESFEWALKWLKGQCYVK